MNSSTKAGGVIVLLAGLLNLTRMIPLVASGEIDFNNFPPQTPVQVAELALTSGHFPSHIMALLSFPLLLIGLLVLYGQLRDRKNGFIAQAMIVSAAFGVLFFTLAVILDGFVMPFAAEQWQAAQGEGAETAILFVTFSHTLALSFFAPAVASLWFGIFLLGVLILQTKVYRAWLAWLGLAIGALGTLGYLSGSFGLRLEHNFQISGTLMMMMYVWFMLLGLFMLQDSRRSKVNVVDLSTPLVDMS